MFYAKKHFGVFQVDWPQAFQKRRASGHPAVKMATPQIEFVYGFHGCAKSVANAVLHSENVSLYSSENVYDWLGSGIYFWEAAPVRALEWAEQKFGQNDAAVLGAKIKLGHCLNLMDIDSYRILRQAYQALVDTKVKLPKNSKLLHRLDCLVINAATMRAEKELNTPYDTVRCPFVEGEPVFPESHFYDHSHIQISVRNHAAIVSLFRVEFEKNCFSNR